MTSAVDEITGRFRTAITQPYRLVSQVDAQAAGVTTMTNLKVITGAVTCTRLADTRRAVQQLRVVDIPTALLPRAGRRSPLDQYGNELVIAAGVGYPGAPDDVELVAQGVFRIATYKIVDTAQGVAVDLTATDRAGWIAKCALLTPWQTAADTTAVDAITALARYFLGPSLEVVDTSTRGQVDTFPQHVLAERANPWSAGIATWAEAVGAEAFFDRHGRLIIRDVPDLTGQPAAWQAVEGVNCTVVEIDASGDDTAPNAVVVAGENPDTSGFRAVAINSDPASPTYYGPDADNPIAGGYGPRPVAITSPLVTSQGQAQAMADARGRTLFAATQQYRLSMSPNPGLVEGDVLHLRRARDGIDALIVADSFPIPLTRDTAQQVAATLVSTVAA